MVFDVRVPRIVPLALARKVQGVLTLFGMLASVSTARGERWVVRDDAPSQNSVSSGVPLRIGAPLQCACPAAIVVLAKPARWEWVYWTNLAITHGNRSSSWGPAVGLGGELTTGVLTYRGFPSGRWFGGARNRAEVRLGPWAVASDRGTRGLIEGGLKLNWGAEYLAQFGTLDLSLGGGHGAHSDEQSGHATMSLAYGIRSALARYYLAPCCDASPQPRTLSMASVLRVAVTLQRPLSERYGMEVVFGLDLSPTLFLPPYNWTRPIGGPPPSSLLKR